MQSILITIKIPPSMIIFQETSNNCPASHSHTPQTAFPLHQDYALHEIHQMHYNKKSDQ